MSCYCCYNKEEENSQEYESQYCEEPDPYADLGAVWEQRVMEERMYLTLIRSDEEVASREYDEELLKRRQEETAEQEEALRLEAERAQREYEDEMIEIAREIEEDQ